MQAISIGMIPRFQTHYESWSRSKSMRYYGGLVLMTPLTLFLDICTLPIQAWWYEHVESGSDG